MVAIISHQLEMQWMWKEIQIIFLQFSVVFFFSLLNMEYDDSEQWTLLLNAV